MDSEKLIERLKEHFDDATLFEGALGFHIRVLHNGNRYDSGELLPYHFDQLRFDLIGDVINDVKRHIADYENKISKK